jgi:FOG: Ankyrin repeat
MRFLTILLSLAPLMDAAAPSLSDQIYAAIRVDDRPGAAKLLSADANTRDSRGNTPLMYAAAVGSVDMMRQLIGAGADVNAKNNFDSTALMWCSNDLQKVRLLLDKGADVNAHSKQGRTPLVIAAAHDGNGEVIRLLIKKGADLKAPGPGGANAALIAAAEANDLAVVRLLLEQGADAKAKSPDGFTALINAAGQGNVAAVKLLLARGADVNAQSNPGRERPVKNGPIAIGSLSPLLVAVTSGSPETVRLLLDHGADVNARDVRGMTPLMLSVATDHLNEKIVRMLLEKRPATDAKSKAGETALDWAAKFQHPSILPAIRTASPGMEPAKREPVSLQFAKRDAREAVEKSVTLMQKATVTFLREGGCVGCHAQNITSLAVAAARAKGVPVDEEAAKEVARGTRLQFAAFADFLLERMDPPATIITIYSLGRAVGRTRRAGPDYRRAGP